MPKSSVFYCPPLEIKKNVDPMMFKGFELNLDFEDEIKPIHKKNKKRRKYINNQSSIK